MQRPNKFIVGIALIVASVAFLVYTAVDQTKMYMITVGEYVAAPNAYSGTTVRLAGRVQKSSMRWAAESHDLYFLLDDIEGNSSVAVHYTGILPDMFAEGRDVIVEGPPAGAKVFQASTILTSCPSKYKPEQSE